MIHLTYRETVSQICWIFAIAPWGFCWRTNCSDPAVFHLILEFHYQERQGQAFKAAWSNRF